MVGLSRGYTDLICIMFLSVSGDEHDARRTDKMSMAGIYFMVFNVY